MQLLVAGFGSARFGCSSVADDSAELRYETRPGIWRLTLESPPPLPHSPLSYHHLFFSLSNRPCSFSFNTARLTAFLETIKHNLVNTQGRENLIILISVLVRNSRQISLAERGGRREDKSKVEMVWPGVVGGCRGRSLWERWCRGGGE